VGVGVFFSSYIVIIIIIPVLGSRVFYYISPYYYTLLERLFCYYSDVSEYAYVRNTENKKNTYLYTYILYINVYFFYSVHGLPLSTAATLSEMDSAFYLERQYKTIIFFLSLKHKTRIIKIR